MRTPKPHEHLHALARFERVQKAYYTMLATKTSLRSAAGSRPVQVKNSVSPGLYEHFMSFEGDPRLVVVFGVVFNEDNVPVVPLFTLYGARAGHVAEVSLLRRGDGFLAPVSTARFRGSRYANLRSFSRERAENLRRHAGQLAQIYKREALLDAIKKIIG